MPEPPSRPAPPCPLPYQPKKKPQATLLSFLGELFDGIQVQEGDGVAMPPPQLLPGRKARGAAAAAAPAAVAGAEEGQGKGKGGKVAALVIDRCVTLYLDEARGQALMEWETGACVRAST